MKSSKPYRIYNEGDKVLMLPRFTRLEDGDGNQVRGVERVEIVIDARTNEYLMKVFVPLHRVGVDLRFMNTQVHEVPGLLPDGTPATSEDTSDGISTHDEQEETNCPSSSPEGKSSCPFPCPCPCPEQSVE